MSDILDVESEEARQERLSKLFSSQSLPTPPPGLTRPTTFPVPQNSELLSRLQNFLPLMASANELLANQDADDLDIENVGEEEAQYVEMDLGLGVFDARLAGEEGDDDEDESSSDEDEDASDSDASSSADDEEADAEEDDAPPAGTPAILDLRKSAAKSPKKGKKPGIVVLEDKEGTAAGDAMKGVEGQEKKESQ